MRSSNGGWLLAPGEDVVATALGGAAGAAVAGRAACAGDIVATVAAVAALPPVAGAGCRPVRVSVNGVAVESDLVVATAVCFFCVVARALTSIIPNCAVPAAVLRVTVPPDDVSFVDCALGGRPVAEFARRGAVAAAARAALADAWRAVAPAAALPDPRLLPPAGGGATVILPEPIVRVPKRSADTFGGRPCAPRTLPLFATHSPLPPILTLADLGLTPLTATFPGAAALAAAAPLGQLATPAGGAAFCACLVPATGDLLLLDPHAADERVRLERLTAEAEAAARAGRGGGEALNPPATLHATAAEVDAMARHGAVAWAWGWGWRVVEGGGSGSRGATVVVDRAATVAGAPLPAAALLGHAHHLAATGGLPSPWPDAVSALASRACRGALMFGTPAPRASLAATLAALALARSPAVCAHGRPTAAVLAQGGALQAAVEARLRVRSGGAARPLPPTGPTLLALLRARLVQAELKASVKRKRELA